MLQRNGARLPESGQSPKRPHLVCGGFPVGLERTLALGSKEVLLAHIGLILCRYLRGLNRLGLSVVL